MKRSLHKITLLSALFFVCFSFAANAYDVTVAKDGSGNYTTVQDAINAAPTGRTSAYSIFIKNGKYKEKINVPSNKPFLQFIGESVAGVILTFDDYSGKPMPGGTTFGTSNSASVTINAVDFTAINITFENTTGEQPQALAININADRAAFKNCRFLGGQDTVLTNAAGKYNYFKNCYIDGTVDFIFGNARAVFDSCVIYAKTRSSAGASYITAANTQQAEPYGYVFRDCSIPANRGGTIYFLGRPWQNDINTTDAAKSWNKVVFLNTRMSSNIQPAGWSTWDAGTDVSKITFAEYKSRKFDGTLADISQRVAWSKQLSDAEALGYYNNGTLFGTWDPCTTTTDFCTYVPAPIAVSNFKGVKGTSTSVFTWNISWPISQVKYEILRSSDKLSFTKISEQTSPDDSTVNYNYSEAIPPPGVTYYYLVRASKAGYEVNISSDTVTISSTPTINVTGSLGSFIQGLGTPSTSQSYVVSGSSLTNNLIITAAQGYELSTNGGSTWNTGSTPVVLTPNAIGNVANTSISVRLNANAAGTYSSNIIHASVGADTVRLGVSGTVQNDPLTVSELLELWPMTVGNADSAAVRSPGIVGTVPVLNRLYLSNGTTVPAVPAYSPTFGQAFGATSNGDGTWTTAAGGPGGNLNRTYYEQYTITGSATHSIRVDSLVLTSSFYNTSSNTKLAVVFSRSGFTSDSADVSGGIGPDGLQLPAGANGAYGTPVAIGNETAGTTTTYRFAFSGGTGITLASGQTLTFRLYFSCGSGSAGRYAKVKNVYVKGLAAANPLAGDYRSNQSGDWTNLSSWERWDGSTWVTPAPAYPVYNNSGTTTILNGHSLTISANLANGSGYLHLTKINKGGQLIVNNGASLNIANDGAPATATTDLQVDGTLTLFGGIFTNGNVSVLINGSFVNSGTGMNLSNPGDTVTVGPLATYQHNVNTNVTPARMAWQPGSTFLVTGITTSQTGIFKNSIKYSNIEWNNTGQVNYYAFRNTLDSANVQGSFALRSTGSSYIAFVNASGRVKIPGGVYLYSGTINFRESGNITDTLEIGNNFWVLSGMFNSNAASGSSLLVKLTGTDKTLAYSQSGAVNTNWEIGGSYNVLSGMTLPTAGFGMIVPGSLNTNTIIIGGPGNFTLLPDGRLQMGHPLGLEGNIAVTGTKSLSTAANYIYDNADASPQVTGLQLPATVSTLQINGPQMITLSANVNATKALVFNTRSSFGTLVAGNFNIVADTVTGAAATNVNGNNYVVTNGTGVLKINTVGPGTNLFPVGISRFSYNPVTINNGGTVDNFAVSVKTTFDSPLPDPNAAVNRQWKITEDVAGGSNATLSFSWLAADQAPGFNPAGAVFIVRNNGTAWEATPAVVTGAGTAVSPYVATASGFTAFSPFAVVNDVALPLSLLSFSAGYVNGYVNALWTTTGEKNVSYFEVERSTDGVLFGKIGIVTARNSGNNEKYSFIDVSPQDGVVYYRLKMFDKDGSYRYSKAVTVNRKLDNVFSIFPNPATSVIVLTHLKIKSKAMVDVMTVDGKKIFSQVPELNTTQTTIDVSGLSAGSYILVLDNGGAKTINKLIKQ